MVNHRRASMKKGMASSRLAAAVCCYAVILTTLVGATIPQGETLLEVAKEWHGLDANSPTYVQYFSSWVAGTDPCVSLWVGTNCSSAGDVEGLNLTQAGLHGPVPAAMSKLTSLKLLDLSNGPVERYYNSNNNFITGDLAPLGSLTNLMYLNMGRNVLGLKVFPEAVKNLTNIRTLLIDNTRIEGPFPDLSNLTKLEKLFLGNNSMTGPFPISLTQITSLRELTLWYNSLTDVLPAALSNLGNLTYFNCNRCKLFGGLPPELGKLTKMKRFHLYKNEMSGQIPREYSAWKSLTELRLELNYFHGSFSPEFFKLANLTKLILNNMQLYGPLPGDLTNNTVPNLKELAMSCNYFTGATPKLTNGAVISGDDQTIPSLAYNCFDGLTQDELGQGTRCNRKLSCQPFQEALQNNGCPDCPPAQRISNTSTCVCMPGGNGKREPWVAPVIGLSAALAVLIIILLVIVFLTSCFRHKPFDKTRDIFGKKLVEEHYDPNWKVPAGLKAFTLAELSHMTKDFSESQVVGQGGFGKVYRGVAPDGKEVAIKRSSTSASSHENTQGMHEFRNEIDLLSRLHHRNLVKLEGFCDEEGIQILVYEYMRHGNLHMIMFRDDLVHYMDWYKRLEIAVETAQGLEYLHHHADPSVIHRDVKPGNILLNEYLQAKVADFGISRESAEYDTHVSTKLAGTAGYFDPQYFLHRQLTKASDVYSYGVCLLELVTGQKAIDHERGQESNLIEWAKPRLNKLGVDSIVDPRLHGDYPPSVFLDMANLAIMCSLFDKNERPTMREVVAVLEPQLKAATRPPQWALPLRAIPELTWRRTGASSSSTENFSHVLRKIQAEDQVPLTEGSTNSSFTAVHVDPR